MSSSNDSLEREITPDNPDNPGEWCERLQKSPFKATAGRLKRSKRSNPSIQPHRLQNTLDSLFLPAARGKWRFKFVRYCVFRD